MKDLLGCEFVRSHQVIVPNLFTIFSRIMYATHAKEHPAVVRSECELFQFEEQEQVRLEDFGSIQKLRSKFVKTVKTPNPFPMIKLNCFASGYSPLLSFRNMQQLSKLSFFDNSKPIKCSTIIFSLTQAACYIGNSNWALLIFSSNQQKIVIIERDSDQLSELSEYCLQGLDFEWVELRYCSKEDTKVLILFGGFQNNRTQIMVFQILPNRSLQLISKKTSVCDHGRVRPVLVEGVVGGCLVGQGKGIDVGESGVRVNDCSGQQQKQTYFWIIGGKKKHKGEVQCYLDYEYFSLQSLMAPNGYHPCKSKCLPLTYPPSQLKSSLYNGICKQSFLLLPTHSLLSLHYHPDYTISITKQHSFIAQPTCSHKRYLQSEVRVRRMGQMAVWIEHVCRAKGEGGKVEVVGLEVEENRLGCFMMVC